MRLPDDVRTRYDLATLIDHLGLKRGVEVGVCLGDFSKHLLENSNLDILYSVDPWLADEDEIKAVFKRCDTHHNKQEHRYQQTVEKLSAFSYRSKIVRKCSLEAVDDFENDSLDFVYLDASHRFTGFALDLIRWYPKVRYGGVVAGHDYWQRYRCEVCPTLCAFAAEHKQFFYVTLEERVKPVYPPSWWFIKTKRDKRAYNQTISQTKPYYLMAVKQLAKKGVFITVPYEYVND